MWHAVGVKSQAVNLKTVRIGTVAAFVAVFGFMGYRGKSEAVRLAQRNLEAARERALIEVEEVKAETAAAGHNNKAIVHARNGEIEAAITEFSNAIEVRKQQSQGKARRELADTYKNRGIVLLRQRNHQRALQDFAEAIEILAKLVGDTGGSGDNAIELASSLKRRSSALRDLGKSAEAIRDLETAIAILEPMLEQQWKDVAAELAALYTERAALHRGQHETSAADLERAIGIRTRLFQEHGQREVARNLAENHNNLGIVLRGKGDLAQALGEFDKAVQIRSKLLESPDAGGGDVVDLKNQLAASYNNRANVLLGQGNAAGALADYEKSIEIRSQLMTVAKSSGLASSLAKTLSVAAWMYATNMDPSVRDGQKAADLAKKACEITEWKATVPLQALAAACAEVDDFPSAIKWQQQVIELADEVEKESARARLSEFQAGQPHRE
ncbi:MAG: tetratricopeptide repeat protein [Verrucomicrobiales bacterium]